MALVCAIYGFNITRPIELPWIRIEPRTRDHREAYAWAGQQDVYHLTAIGVIREDASIWRFQLQAALSFIERLDVIVTPPREELADNIFDAFTKTIEARYRNSGGGAVIAQQYLFSESRGTFLKLLLSRLQDTRFCEATTFDRLFFKAVESFRQVSPSM